MSLEKDTIKEKQNTDVKKSNAIEKKSPSQSKENKKNCDCGCVHSKGPLIKKSELFDREKEMSIVKGMFHFHEQKGKTLKWWDRFPWRGAKMKKYEARDQSIVEIPYYVARRLMEKGNIPVIREVKDENGRPVQKVVDYKRRFDFFPLNTVMPEPNRPRIVRALGS